MKLSKLRLIVCTQAAMPTSGNGDAELMECRVLRQLSFSIKAEAA